ncbi:ribonuclease E/G [Neomegalonema sp.]|uniref:ribonuclease E/G n=1 Tax=Neomegalonema sp. TaxID=2039713 RepID=UPI002635D6B8|nr:ribonuclease E/G [Neomegalonema sp.]MDD2869502.1 ribonuclease E/G [Neomegalonema sp.]
MSRTALFSRDARRDLAALIHDGRLEDLFLRPATAQERAGPGDLHAAKVESVAPRLDAAFLDIGGGEGGFLTGGGGLTPGARILATVQRAAEGDKAARCRLGADLPGPWLVFTPLTPGINVSRKIEDPAIRKGLQAALASFAPEGGFVIRTEAAGLAPEALRAEAARLVEEYRVMETAAASGPPRRLKAGPGLFARALGLWRGAELLADAGAAAEVPEARLFAGSLMEAWDLDSRLADLTAPQIPLSGGGWMKIETTLALIAVDVNAGGDRMGVNRAAAREIPRRLRLLGLGGAVAVDFAGDLGEADRAGLARVLGSAQDPAWRPLGWGPLGFFEATRRRDRPPLSAALAELGGSP